MRSPWTRKIDMTIYFWKKINAAGYRGAFNQAAIELLEERLTDSKINDGKCYNTWDVVAVWWSIHSLCIPTELYGLDEDDTTYRKSVLPVLKRHGTIAAADNLYKALRDLEEHQKTPLMKAVAKLSASTFNFGYTRSRLPIFPGDGMKLEDVLQTTEEESYVAENLAFGCEKGFYERRSN